MKDRVVTALQAIAARLGEEVASATPPARAGYLLIAITFGLMGGWAAIAPLARAVVTNGAVVAESSRKAIQHLEGGVVAAIAVTEGQSVQAGDVLLRLSPVQAQANLDIIRGQLYAEQALAARLTAESTQAGRITYPVEMEFRSDAPVIRAAMREQEGQFRERAASQALHKRVLEARIDQLQAEMRGLAADLDSSMRQLVLVKEELVGLRELKGKGLSTLSRLLAAEKERTRLEGLIARNAADKVKLAASLEETRLQLAQARQKFLEEVAANLAESRKRLIELHEKMTMAEDVLARLDIRSPVAGTVQGLKVGTIGQVIRAGEPLMEVAQAQANLVVHAHIPVHEIEHVAVGQRVEIRFPGFHGRRMPLFEGQLRSVSQDRVSDERNQPPYYLGVVTLDADGIPEPYRARLIAGMPADITVVTGSRTALNYLVSPLTDAFQGSFRN